MCADLEGALAQNLLSSQLHLDQSQLALLLPVVGLRHVRLSLMMMS